MTDVYYGLAIQKRQQRYNNKSSLVFQRHIREIMNSLRIQSASAQEVSKVQSHVAVHLATLETLGLPIEHWGAWIVTVIVESMDRASSHEWQLQQGIQNYPNMVK